MTKKQKHLLLICSSNSVGHCLLARFSKEDWIISQTSRNKASWSDTENKHYFLDISSDESISAFSKAVRTGAKIDVMIFLCGYLGGRSLTDLDCKDVMAQFNVNAISQIKIVKMLLTHINDEGRVVFLNSISAFNGSYDPVYAASKAAIVGFIKSMAKHNPKNIRFNAVAPGLIEDSKMANQFSSADIDRHKCETPTGVLNSSIEIAEIVFEICGDKWRNMNGQVIHINGGRYV